MKLNINRFYKILFFVLYLLIVQTSKMHAQTQNKIGNEEINVIAPYEPTISDAYKIVENPVISDTTIEKPKLSYSIESKPVYTVFQTQAIEPAKMSGDPLVKLYKNYLKLGLGNNMTPVGEYYINNLRSKDILIGAHLRHFSSEGNVMKYGNSAFSENNAGIYARKFFKNQILVGQAGFDRNVVHYYGYNDTLPETRIKTFIDSLNKDIFKQRFSIFTIGGELTSNKPDSSKYINQSVKFNYYNLADRWDASENNLKLDAMICKRFNFHKKTGDRIFLIHSKIDYFNNKNAFNNNNSALFSLMPQMTDTYKEFRIDAGVDAVIVSEDVARLHVYPVVEVNAFLVKQILTFFFGTTGGMEKNSIKSIINENPYITSLLPTNYTNNKFKLYGGVKGAISSYVAFNLSIAQEKINNKAFFVNDTSGYLDNKFTLAFDDVELLRINGQISAHSGEKAKFVINAEYKDYTMDKELKPWHEPNLKMSFSLYYNIGDKLIFKGDVYSFGESYAKTYSNSIIPTVVPKKVLGIVDFNFGFEYRYTKILSAFVTFNNIEGVKHVRYYNYPTQGFNFIAGIAYSF